MDALEEKSRFGHPLDGRPFGNLLVRTDQSVLSIIRENHCQRRTSFSTWTSTVPQEIVFHQPQVNLRWNEGTPIQPRVRWRDNLPRRHPKALVRNGNLSQYIGVYVMPKSHRQQGSTKNQTILQHLWHHGPPSVGRKEVRKHHVRVYVQLTTRGNSNGLSYHYLPTLSRLV